MCVVLSYFVYVQRIGFTCNEMCYINKIAIVKKEQQNSI